MITEIFEALGIKYKVLSSGNLSASCPFAPFTHSGGVDKHPSFTALELGVNDFVFHCFACGVKGNKVSFKKLALKYGLWRDIAAIYSKYEDLANVVSYLPDFEQTYFRRYSIKGLRQPRQDKTSDVPREKLAEVVPLLKKYVSYLSTRGIDREVAFDFKIGYDANKRAIIFPIFDVNYKFVAYSYRFLTGERKYYHLPGFVYGDYFYGEHQLNQYVFSLVWGIDGDEKMFQKVTKYFTKLFAQNRINLNYDYLFIVEGFFDVLKLYSFGFLSVATMGHSSISSRRRGLLINYILNHSRFSEMMGNTKSRPHIVVLGDGDKSGKEFADKLYREIKEDFLAVSRLICPDGMDPADFKTREEFIKFLSDNLLVFSQNERGKEENKYEAEGG